jgi:excisionase family DNA binding protein
MNIERIQNDYLTTMEVARSLSISDSCIRRWIGRGRLQSEVVDRVHCISREELRKLAMREPRVFGGLSEEELVQLLNHDGIAQWVAEQRLPVRRMCLPVICLETGQRFSSIGAAAVAAGVCKQTMRKAVIEGYRTKGKRYRLLRPDVVSTSGRGGKG